MRRSDVQVPGKSPDTCNGSFYRLELKRIKLPYLNKHLALLD